MASVDKVKSWMTWFGWSDGGTPGSVKRDAFGKVVAYHGDNTWQSDVDSAIIRVERDKRNSDLMDEFEARGY